jgi:hypothetical protein
MMRCHSRCAQSFAGWSHAVSEAFLQLYLEPTFLADRNTSLAACEKEHSESRRRSPEARCEPFRELL